MWQRKKEGQWVRNWDTNNEIADDLVAASQRMLKI